METTINKKLIITPTHGMSRIIVRCIVYFFISIFCITSAFQLINYTKWVLFLSKLPLIGTYQEFLAFSIPAIELFIAILFTSKLTRGFAGVLSLGFLISTSLYLGYIILQDIHLLCLCEGVLNWYTSWRQILGVAIVLTALNILCIELHKPAISKFDLKNLKKNIPK